MATTWTEEILKALTALGGKAKYGDLYSYFKNGNIKNYNNKVDGDAQIRGTIEAHSSASTVFKKKSLKYQADKANNLFYPVGKLGDGIWGIRSYAIEDEPLTTVISEGTKSKIYTTKYERNNKNRELAIKFHGCYCHACGFNFEKQYGDLGKGFIEVHHIKPLYSLKEAIEVDPKKDLIPLCPNCHRMIHRNKSNMMTVDELIKRMKNN